MPAYLTRTKIGRLDRSGAWCLCTLLMFALFLCEMAKGQSTGDLSSRAVQAMQAGDYAEAEKLFLRLTVAAPDVPESYSNLGLAQYYEKKPDLARKAFAKALSLKATLFVPNFFLAKMDCEEGKYAAALPRLREAVKLEPREPASRSLLADVLSQLGSKTEAIAQYELLLKQQPRDENALYGLARAYLDEARRYALLLKASDAHLAAVLKAESDSTLPEWHSVAVEEWNTAFSGMPAIPGLRIPFASFLLSTNKLSEADTAFQKELEIDPFSYRALFGLAQLSLLRGDLETAIKHLNQAARIRPEFFYPLPNLSLMPEHSEQYYDTLKTQDGEMDFGRAFLMSELAGKIGVSSEGVRWQAAAQERRDDLQLKITAQLRATMVPASYEQRRTLGLKYVGEKRLDQGLRLLTPVAKTDKTNAQVKITVGRALFEEQRFQDAAAFLNDSQARDPESLYLLASSYKTLATETMDALVKVDPQSVDLQKLMAESLSDRKMFKEAADQYRSALKLRPDDPDLFFGLGEACFDQMQFEDAEQAYSHAIELRPSDPAFYVMRASALVELHRPEEAISSAKRALELNPNLLQAHVSMGRALALMGRDQEAVQELEKAASTDDDGMLHYAIFKLYRNLGRADDANRALQISNELKRRSASTSERNGSPPMPNDPQPKN